MLTKVWFDSDREILATMVYAGFACMNATGFGILFVIHMLTNLQMGFPIGFLSISLVIFSLVSEFVNVSRAGHAECSTV